MQTNMIEVEFRSEKHGYVYEGARRRMGFTFGYPIENVVNVWPARGWQNLSPEALNQAVDMLQSKFGAKVEVLK